MSEAATNPGGGGTELTFTRLRVGATDERGNGWYGMIAMITTEACLFAYLLFSYYYMALHFGRDWLPHELPGFRLSLPDTIILMLSSVAVWFGERAIKRGQRWVAVCGLIVGSILGLCFVGIEFHEWSDQPFTLSTSSYGSLFFIVTGFHMGHVVAGLMMLAAIELWTALGLFDARRHDAVSIASLYWHFVDVVWAFVFFTFYITPYLFNPLFAP